MRGRLRRHLSSVRMGEFGCFFDIGSMMKTPRGPNMQKPVKELLDSNTQRRSDQLKLTGLTLVLGWLVRAERERDKGPSSPLQPSQRRRHVSQAAQLASVSLQILSNHNNNNDYYYLRYHRTRYSHTSPPSRLLRSRPLRHFSHPSPSLHKAATCPVFRTASTCWRRLCLIICLRVAIPISHPERTAMQLD